MNLTVYLQQTNDSVLWVATCPALPGCVSQGETQDEAVANIKEAIVGWLVVRNEQAAKGMRKTTTKGIKQETRELCLSL